MVTNNFDEKLVNMKIKEYICGLKPRISTKRQKDRKKQNKQKL